jgi:23S rRNA (cytosine1962-C5)-methyltransferase
MMTGMMKTDSIVLLLETAIAARVELFDERHETAFRLFNGFTEGHPNLVIDLYAKTIVLHNYADQPANGFSAVQTALEFLPARLPWVQTVVVKTRNSPSSEEKRGKLVYGTKPDHKIRENGVWYAIDVMLNRDASFYLDTRNVRVWAKAHLAGKSVLNTFAYTGSLGIAAQAGGAARVVHLDLNRNFLNVAKTSYTLNGFPINKSNFQAGDFWPQINRMKAANERFDCVFLDPPIYSATKKGVVNLAESYTRVINKVRPLINDGGYLVAINNALFYSGKDYLQEIEALCVDGYLTIAEMIPVPVDFIGNLIPPIASAIADPAPFNHSTKIVVMNVRRKA